MIFFEKSNIFDDFSDIFPSGGLAPSPDLELQKQYFSLKWPISALRWSCMIVRSIGNLTIAYKNGLEQFGAV